MTDTDTMSRPMAGTRTLTAFFDSDAEARRAQQRLVSAGIPSGDIRIIAGGQTASTQREGESGGGFWEALKDLFIPDEDRHTYAEGLRRGGHVLTVRVPAEHYERALDILDDEGTVDIDQREAQWRGEGWTPGYGGLDAGPATGEQPARATELGAAGASVPVTGTTPHMAHSPSIAEAGEESIQLAEERLRVGKRDVSHGRVRVRSYVVETPVEEEVTLHEERAVVERRPVDRPVGAGDALFEDKVVEVEEFGEEAVVSKEARVTEEVVVGKTVEDRTETVRDTVRRTELDVEDESGTRGSGRKKPV